MLELIRGVSSPKLRQEFLRQKDPTLEGLLQIAKNWQVATDVEKDLETLSTTVDSRKASSYQQDKFKKWQNKSGKGQEDQTTSSSGQETNCGWCGRKKTHTRDQCPARDKECTKCGRKGHFQAVCRGGALWLVLVKYVQKLKK